MLIYYYDSENMKNNRHNEELCAVSFSCRDSLMWTCHEFTLRVQGGPERTRSHCQGAASGENTQRNYSEHQDKTAATSETNPLVSEFH